MYDPSDIELARDGWRELDGQDSGYAVAVALVDVAAALRYIGDQIGQHSSVVKSPANGSVAKAELDKTRVQIGSLFAHVERLNKQVSERDGTIADLRQQLRVHE